VREIRGPPRSENPDPSTGSGQALGHPDFPVEPGPPATDHAVQDGGVGGCVVPRVSPVAIVIRSLRDEGPGCSFPLRASIPHPSHGGEGKEKGSRRTYLFIRVQLRLHSSESLAKVKGWSFFAGFDGAVFVSAMSCLSTRRFSSGNHRTGFRFNDCAPNEGNDRQPG
jgi:hypothetical protein